MTALTLRRLRNPSLVIATIALVALIATGFAMNARFASLRNLSNLLEQSAPLGLLALGQLLVILVGGIDLSIGAIVTAVAVFVAALCALYPELAPLVLVGGLGFGTALGALNGLLVNRTGVHPLIVTLGTASIIGGCVLVYTMKPVGEVPLWLEDASYGGLWGVPFVAMVMLAAFAAVAATLGRTATGQAIYAVGGNPAAAAAAGLSANRVNLLAYSASGFFAALAGVYFAARTGTGDPRVGDAMTLASITPVVVDGARDITIIRRIIIPLTRPALATAAVLSFQAVWGSVEASNNFITDDSLRTLAFYLNAISTNNTVASAGMVAAASVLLFLPNLVIFIIMQSQVMNTMSHSGIK